MTRAIVRAVLLPLAASVTVLALPLVILLVTTDGVAGRELVARQAGTVALLVTQAAESRSLPDLSVLDLAPDERVELRRLDGTVVAAAGADLVIDSEHVPQATVPGEVVAADRDNLVVASVSVATDLAEPVVVVVAEPNSLTTRTWVELTAVAVATFVLIGSAIVAGRRLGRDVSSPIGAVLRVARLMGDGDLAARAPTDRGPAEIRELAAQLNSSAAALDQVLTAQRQLVATAAHELRTPLTGLRLRLENVALAQGLENELDPAMAEVDRLAGTISTLLLLARAEAGTLEVAPVDVAAALRTQTDLLRDRMDAAGVDLEVDLGPGPIWALAVPGVTGQALANFVTNAARVTPRGGRILVQAHREETAVVVSVGDRGPGMDESARSQAFDRFWRGPDAQRDGGSGLGLPIVRTLARASGGDAELRERDGGGTLAVLTLKGAPVPEEG